MKKIDMIGFRSGKLTVIEECGKYRQETKWLCKCDCGEIVLIPGYHLRKGLRTSYGKNLTIREWSDLTGIPYTTIRARLNYGWKDPEKILTR